MLLSISLLATGCSAQWIKVALADLPVLVQMALNIGSLVTTLQSGKQLSLAEVAAVQNISNQASRDLNLLQTLYNEYKASPSTATIQKIQNSIADINQNLPALLQAAHITDPVLSTRVAAGVNLILSTINSFAALIPQSTGPLAAQKVARKSTPAPRVSDLKKQWNQQVCRPTGNGSLDYALPSCEVK
jgi:hypothetical protein